MKIALISDIHGNPFALDAILQDVSRLGVTDEQWILGDLAALGPDPVGVLERLRSLPAARFVRGNTDRYVCTGDRPGPTHQEAAGDPGRIARLVEMASSFSWTQGALTASGHFEFLENLPLEIDTMLLDGTHLLGVHASPGRDDGPGFSPDDSDKEMLELLRGTPPGLVCVGHTHQALSRKVGDWHVINLGSTSNPMGEDKRASYALLHADESGYRVEHRRVAYDYQPILTLLEKTVHPGAAFIARHFR